MPFGGAGHSCDHIFHAPGAKPWHYATDLHIFSLFSSVVIDSSDNLSEKGPINFTDHQSFTILQGLYIPPMFAHCCDSGLNLQPPGERAGSLTTQQIKLASYLRYTVKNRFSLKRRKKNATETRYTHIF